MLSLKEDYEPQRNSMADPVELSSEAIRQEALQKLDRGIKPYNIWGKGGYPLPPCLKAMDRVLTEKEMK